MRKRTELAVRSRPARPETYSPAPDRHRNGTGDIVRETVPARTLAADAGGHDRDRETPEEKTSRHFGTVVRVLFGFMWLADAYFKWQPSFLNHMLDVMHDGTMGQPPWLMPWFRLNRALMATQPLLWAVGIAVLETAIALALIFGVARKVTYVGGAVWSMLIWATAEGFGRTRPGEIATDIGTAIIYAVVFLALLAADQCRATRPYSLDALIERRFSWWTRLAEVRR